MSLSSFLRAGRVLPLVALLAVVGRAVIACGDDSSGSTNGLPPAEAGGGGEPVGPGTDETDGAPKGPPTYCAGIVFLASFDASFTSERGVTTALSRGNAGLVPTGKFGGSVALTNPDGGDGGGAAVYYRSEDGGAFPWPASGTISYWYRGSALHQQPSAGPVFVRALGSNADEAIVPGGLVVTRMGAQGFGVFESTQSTTRQAVTVPAADIWPFVKESEFNHFAVGWREVTGNDPDAPRSWARLAVNGGIGEVMTPPPTPADAGSVAPDGGAAGDAGGEDGGTFSPYRVERPYEWSATPKATFRVGGTALSAPQGEIDDVVMWDRMLSFDEIAEVYRAGASVAAVCGLR